MHVVHFITRLIIGGAQENTLLTVEDQHNDYSDKVTLITGPGLGPEGSLMARAEAGGFDLQILPRLKRNIFPLDDWRSQGDLVALLKEIKPDIVHTHSSKAGIMGRAAATKLKIPAVHTIHGPSFYQGQNKLAYHLFLQAEKWAAKRCDKIISVCDAMTHQYVAANVAPQEKFITIYSGMDVEPFLNPPRSPEVVRQELGILPEHIVVGKIARLFRLKGHKFIIQAARDVVKKIPQIQFLFVGDGNLRTQFEQQIAAAGLSEHFIFTGLVPPARVPELIHAMDIVVHTSLREGLARVLPQGLIAGKPVISYDIDGAKEVVIPNETGHLLPPESITELTTAIIELALNSTLRRKLGDEGRKRFTDQFRHQTMTKRIREVYQELL
ncbi:putative glycosyl transferase (WbnE) [hydrothermal vent metagenome]|uniref:Putative glycosyl transferase (WbnE) n=1 Tax=hydrothermal vent metagenome TaxID=652676 RepID=A0A3B1DNI2_9ZZZZ